MIDPKKNAQNKLGSKDFLDCIVWSKKTLDLKKSGQENWDQKNFRDIVGSV